MCGRLLRFRLSQNGRDPGGPGEPTAVDGQAAPAADNYPSCVARILMRERAFETAGTLMMMIVIMASVKI